MKPTLQLRRLTALAVATIAGATIAIAGVVAVVATAPNEELTVAAGNVERGGPTATDAAAPTPAGLRDAIERSAPILGPPVESISPNADPVPRLASQATDELRSHFDARFAGAWDIEHSDGSATAVVALVDPRPDDVDAVSTITGSAQVATPSAKYGLGELEALSSELSAKLAASGLESYGVGVNVPTNRVTLLVDTSSVASKKLREWLITIGGRDEVILEDGSIQPASYPNAN